MAGNQGYDFSPSKIVSCTNGIIKLHEENILEILNNSISKSKILCSNPFAIISIIGPRRSGKTLLTNILIQYLRNFEEGGWLEKFVSQAKKCDMKFPGFEIRSTNVVQPNSRDTVSSAIYLWPEPFPLNLNGRNVTIWVLHISLAENEKEKNILALENFLVLASTQVGEILHSASESWMMRLETTPGTPTRLLRRGALPFQKILFIYRGNKSEARKSYQYKNAVMIDDFQSEIMNPLGVINGHNLHQYTSKIKQAIQKLVYEGELVIEKTSLIDHLRSSYSELIATHETMDKNVRSVDSNLRNDDSIMKNSLQANPQSHQQHVLSDITLTTGKTYSHEVHQGNYFEESVNPNVLEIVDRTSVENEITRDLEIDVQNIIQHTLEGFKNMWGEKAIMLAQEKSTEKVFLGIDAAYNYFKTKLFKKALCLPEEAVAVVEESFRLFVEQYTLALRQSSDAFEFELRNLKATMPTKMLEASVSQIYQRIVEKHSTTNSYNIEMILQTVYGHEKIKLWHRVNEQRKHIITTLSDVAVQFYAKNCIPILERDVISPCSLKEIHSKITSHLYDSIKNSTPYIDEDSYQSLAPIEETSVALEIYFHRLLEKNFEKIRHIRVAMSKAIKTSNTNYARVVEMLFEKYKQNPKVLIMEHDKLKNTSKQELLKSICLVRKTEPTTLHLNCLQVHMDEYWLELKDELKRMEQQRETLTMTTRKQIKSADTQKLSVQIHKSDCSIPDELWSTSQGHRASTLPTGATGGYSQINQKNRNSSAVAFHLQSSCIKFATVEGVKENSKTRAMPFSVGLTEKGKIICGNELKKHQPVHDCLWSCMTCITSDEWEFKVQIGTKYHIITREFVVGFIFKKIKQYAEDDILGQSIDTVVIAVPLWFSSSQRLFLRDVAKIAGFNNVYLVNENSAAAYACVKTSDRFSKAENLIIISENSGKVDVSVYQYCSKENVVRMVGHSGNYCVSKQSQTGGGTRWFVGIFESILTKVSSMTTRQSTESESLKLVLYEAVKNASESKDGEVKKNMNRKWEIFKFMEPSYKLKSVLNDMSMENSEQLCYMKDDDIALVGAAMLSENPSEIFNNIHDLVGFDVLITAADYHFQCKSNKIPAEIEVKLKFTNVKERISVQQNWGENAKERSLVAGFVKTRNLTRQKSLQGNLQINHEHIIQFLPFSEDFTWYPNGVMTDEQVATARSLMEHFKIKKV